MLYSLSEIQSILQQLNNECILPTSILQTIDRIEKEINNSSIKKMYSTPSIISTNENNPVIRNKENRTSYSLPPTSNINRYKEKEKDYLSWENIRNFKITKIEKKRRY